MPYSTGPSPQVLQVRTNDAVIIGNQFEVSDFEPSPSYGVGVKRIDPSATPDGTAFTFEMDEVAVPGTVNLPPSSLGTRDDAAIAIDGSTLYALDNASGVLRTISKADGSTVTTVGTFTAGATSAAVVPSALSEPARFYFIAGSTFGFVELSSFSQTIISSSIPGTPTAIAFDRITGTMYLINDDGELHTINRDSGALSYIGVVAPGVVLTGMTFDEIRRVLWAVGNDTNDTLMYQVDPITGVFSAVGTVSATAYSFIDVCWDDDTLFFTFDDDLHSTTFNPASSEWDCLPFDAVFYIDGNANFVQEAGAAVFKMNSTTIPIAGEFYLVGVFRVVSSNPQNLLDFFLVRREPDQIPVFDSTTATIDLEGLQRAHALVGGNTVFKVTDFSNGQPTQYELRRLSMGNITRSVDPSTLDDMTGVVEVLPFETIVDNSGNEIMTKG